MTKVFGTHESQTLKQIRDVAERAVATALMADGHFGYVMPIGGVAAYNNHVSVVGVGFDIACGNCAIRTDTDAGQLPDIAELADEIERTVSFGVGRTNRADDAPVDHPLFSSDAWNALPTGSHTESLKNKARSQLGTVGSGNHYVDVFVGTDGRVTVGVHFGSRGLGHTIASGFMALAQGKPWGTKVPEQETLFDLDTQIGKDYWALMQLAGEYAYAGREWVTRKVVGLFGGEEIDRVHNHHNFAWREKHFGQDLVVVRKGATPAFPGQRGFVGGSMGDDAVILQGCESPESIGAMYSTVHGAGRVLGRQDARRGKAERDADGKPTGKRDTSTIVTREMVKDWVGARGTVVRGGDVDEGPQVYRRLPDVLEAQGDTIKVLEVLTPLIVVMAGGKEYDPYKD